jgi:hypothetical protein
MEHKTINLLVLDNEIFDRSRLLKAKETQEVINGSVKKDFCFEGEDSVEEVCEFLLKQK